MSHTVFVSSCRIDDPYTAALIDSLRQEQCTVLHSPRNPHDGEDGRWYDWYVRGCQEELDQTDVFIISITQDWDCSTWMAYEAQEARKRLKPGGLRAMFWHNPAQLTVQSANMAEMYLKERLPDKKDAAMSRVRQALKGASREDDNEHSTTESSGLN